VDDVEWQYPWVIPLVGEILLLLGVALGLRYLYRRYKYNALGAYYRWIRNPLNKYLVHPVRRARTRRKGNAMAKWRKGYVADLLYGHIFQDWHDGKITKHEATQVAKLLGKEWKDLLPGNKDRRAIARRLEKNKEYEIGPKNPIPGPKPGENVIPIREGLGSKYLSRKKSA